jgi:Tfp pilus assembly protein FimT
MRWRAKGLGIVMLARVGVWAWRIRHYGENLPPASTAIAAKLAQLVASTSIRVHSDGGTALAKPACGMERGFGTERSGRSGWSWLGRRLRDQGGWTLMEALVVCGMITVLAGIAVPQYATMAQHMRTGAAASQVLGDLAYARSMAQRTGVHHYLQATGGSGVSYQVKRCAAGPATGPADVTLRTVTLGDQMPGVSFDRAGAAADPYGAAVTTAIPTNPTVFDPRGLPVSGASYFVASQDGVASYAVSVNGSGRVRLWKRRDGDWQ